MEKLCCNGVHGDDSFRSLEESSSSSGTIPSTQDSSILGLQRANVHQFSKISELQRIVDAQSSDLQQGRFKTQYLIFNGGPRDNLDKIDHHRSTLGKHTQMRYHPEEDFLIIKLIPSRLHEMAHREFEFMIRVRMMGISSPQMHAIGSTRITGRDGSSAKPDSVYVPFPQRSRSGSPTLVVEAGASESLTGLQSIAQWGILQSGGDVHIVLIISLNQPLSTILIEKWWESTPPLTGRSHTRSLTRQEHDPRCVQGITITRALELL